MSTYIPRKSNLLTLKEVAIYLKVHPSTITRLVARRDAMHLPGFQIRSEWRFDIDTVDKWRFAQEIPCSK